jgi:hypothetical protein
MMWLTVERHGKAHELRQERNTNRKKTRCSTAAVSSVFVTTADDLPHTTRTMASYGRECKQTYLSTADSCSLTASSSLPS